MTQTQKIISEVEINEQLVKDHSLNDEEYAKILEILGREPSLTELGIFSAMWSEHCSYKSTRYWLKTLHTQEDWVICGPGENAGVIDIGDNQAAIFKMESHNHPSFIEPHQGAATGVGGILRDVFTMGARPIANMNALRFGEINHPKTKYLVNGVVEGISSYGNCIGVPTIGGETNFHKSFNGNILVNAMTVGLAQQDKIFYSAASDVGASVVYVGSKTGRDGINGAVMASDEFSDHDEDKRPTVQVGDPFTEKLLLEACLELMQDDCILSIQDMGAAGLTSSSVEMASKGGTGIEMNLDQVPQREENMTPYEIMLSESQERMLMVIKPEKEARAREVFEKWGIDFAIIGKVVDNGGQLIIKMHGQTYAQLPAAKLADESPIYQRPYDELKADEQEIEIANDPDIISSLKTLLSTPDLAEKSWIYRQYDSQVMNDTLQASGGDASLVRVRDTQKALAVSTDCTPRYVQANPYLGAQQAVVETYRNICAVGAKPLAITNCLNFGNPQKPEIMSQIVHAIKGIGDASRKLKYPVISGNVSLYNETNGTAIQPTPAIGGVGLLQDLEKRCDIKFKNEGDVILLIGQNKGHLGASLAAREVLNQEYGSAPEIDLDEEIKNGQFVQNLIQKQQINACHDIADGGLLIAITEMALASQIGAKIEIKAQNISDFALFFGEDQARYVISTSKEQVDEILKNAEKQNVEINVIGEVGSDSLKIQNYPEQDLKGLEDVYYKTLQNKL